MDRVEAAVKHVLAINRLPILLVSSHVPGGSCCEARPSNKSFGILLVSSHGPGGSCFETRPSNKSLGILLVSSHGPGGSCCEARPSNESFGYTLGFIPWTGWKLL